VGPSRLRQVGRAMRELHIEMIPAYSPQARGRKRAQFRHWQGRLPQELRLRGINSMEEANRFLPGGLPRGVQTVKFSVAAAQPESAFCSGQRKRSRAYLYGATGTGGQPGQHRTDSQPHAANRKKQNGAARWPNAACWSANTWTGRGACSMARTW